MSARGAEYEAVAKLSREVIERIAWEVVPELAETIIREQLDRLVAERQKIASRRSTLTLYERTSLRSMNELPKAYDPRASRAEVVPLLARAAATSTPTREPEGAVLDRRSRRRT